LITTKTSALSSTAVGGDFYHDVTNKFLNVRIDGKKLGNYVISGISCRETCIVAEPEADADAVV
jgi:hypothetical protein